MQAMVAAGLARLKGQSTGVGIMWWRVGFEDLRHRIKRVSVTLVRKRMKKKEKNITFLMCLQIRQWWQWDLQGLRGEAQWRGGGLRTWHVGKRGLCNTGQKRNKRRKKNISLLVCPQMQAMVVEGLGRLEGQSTVVGIMCGEAGF